MRTTDDIWVVHQWAVFGRLLQTNTDCKYKLTRANNSGLWKHAGITADSSQMLWSYLDKDVQTCSTTLSRLQSSEQSRLINDAPTCTVYHLYSSLAFSKTFIIEKTWNIEQKKIYMSEILFTTATWSQRPWEAPRLSHAQHSPTVEGIRGVCTVM